MRFQLGRRIPEGTRAAPEGGRAQAALAALPGHQAAAQLPPGEGPGGEVDDEAALQQQQHVGLAHQQREGGDVEGEEKARVTAPPSRPG